MWHWFWGVTGVLCVCAGVAAAETPAATESQKVETPRDWHAGINYRTDWGTHPLRIDGGIRSDSVDFILVLDPMFWIDGQHDIDLIVDWRFGNSGWSLMTGYRSTSIGIADGRHWHHKTIVGLGARLPTLFDGAVMSQVGLELSTLWVKHGAGLDTETISFTSRDVVDMFNLGMFLRFEYASAL